MSVVLSGAKVNTCQSCRAGLLLRGWEFDFDLEDWVQYQQVRGVGNISGRENAES